MNGFCFFIKIVSLGFSKDTILDLRRKFGTQTQWNIVTDFLWNGDRFNIQQINSVNCQTRYFSRSTV